MSKNVLRLENITMQFGGVVAINDLSMRIDEGEIVALIGPNGAGKTTAFNCITGVYEPTNGAVYFHDKVIAAAHPTGKMKRMYAGNDLEKFKGMHVQMTPDKITHMGIARTFQNIRLFKSQTAFENVLIGTHLRRTSNVFSATFHLNGKEENRNREKAMELLDIVGLADVAEEKATSLPYGKQRRLEIGFQPHRVRHRAPHGFGHGHFRPHLRDRVRQADRRGHPRGNSEQPGGHRRLSGRE